MAKTSVDLFVIGGGINGAAIARDAAGRGLRVMLAERGDYASATSSASSKLIHGGLRYLEGLEFGLVRESLNERDALLKSAPHLVEPLRFLVPITYGQRRSPWLVYAGLKFYDLLAGQKSVASSGRLNQSEIATLTRLRKDDLRAVFHYTDCRTDDARLVLALLLDARERGADIANYRDVRKITALADGYRVNFHEAGQGKQIDARFVVNAAGPWANKVRELCDRPPPEHSIRLVRGSHIVLAMPEPRQTSAYTLQNDDGRVVFTLPWLDERFLVLGTTDAPHRGDAAQAKCTTQERDYLLQVYEHYFGDPKRPLTARDVISDWSGVRALADDGKGDPSKVTRSSSLSAVAQGAGGFVSVYGGKLTTHRSLAERVMKRLKRMGAEMGSSWTLYAPLHGGTLTRSELVRLAANGPSQLAAATLRRWVYTYGERARALYDAIEREPHLADEIAAGVTLAELVHARDVEDARCADDFLLRRTKLFIDLTPASRQKIDAWFAH